MAEAGASSGQAETMLYAAIRASEAHIAEMRNDISGRFDALETRFDALETSLGGRLDALETKIDALETSLGGRLDRIGRQIKALGFAIGIAVLLSGIQHLAMAIEAIR